LVGLDAYGRALYHDEKMSAILRVVPKHGRCFKNDRTGDETPLREYPGRHNPGRGKLINGPDGRDLLVPVEEINTDSNEFRKKHLAEWLATREDDEKIKALTESAADQVEYYADNYDKPRYDDDVFPSNKARALLKNAEIE
jgi:hypothetical protein